MRIVASVLLGLCCAHWGARSVQAGTMITLDESMPPPEWALLERRLLDAHLSVCEEFIERYFDSRGHLLCVERWGGDDGPDDAIENVNGWPVLHALGADDRIYELYKKVWEGHLRQYTEAKTKHVPFARDGMYYKEFPVKMDWLHNGEGLTVFGLQSLSDPDDVDLRKRMLRFAGFYMNEDPQAPNYDPEHKIIRSLFNGSRGPLMRKATGLDWAGDPIEVKGRFRPRHGEETYAQMWAHFKDYNDIVGDHPLNLSATSPALHAYMLTGKEKYKAWLLEYVDAWVERARANDDILPTNIGLDGTIGGAADGKWYGGVYGWSFTVDVPQEPGVVDHRNMVQVGLRGFGNAHLVTGDDRYLDVWRKMLAKINSNGKEINGAMHYPFMYGDDGWYNYQPHKYDRGAIELYYWSQKAEDRELIRSNEFFEYLEGKDPGYPTRVLRRDFLFLGDKLSRMRAETTTPDTRLADDPMRYNPATIRHLNQLMVGGLHLGTGGLPWHCRVRFFDPERRRSGIAEDVASLVQSMDADSVTLELVNVNPSESRSVIVQAGGYAEHQFLSVTVEEATTMINDGQFKVRLKPGAGGRLTISMKRYVNQPTASFPWDR